MYVFEEMIEGKKLTEIINTTHENVKYLPGHKLPENVVSCRSLIYLIIRKWFDKKRESDLERLPIVRFAKCQVISSSLLLNLNLRNRR